MLDNGCIVCNLHSLAWGNTVILSIIADKNDWKIKLL